YPFDPSQPCVFPPGSEEKIACLAARLSRGLPLFLPGDAEKIRKVNNTQPSDSGKRSPLERLILETVTYQPVKARELAARSGAKLGPPFSRALMQLHRAGVLLYDRKRGWRLAEV